MKRLLMVGAVIAVSACGPNDPSGRAAGVGALMGDTTRGATVYMGQCVSCHAADGKGVAAVSGADLTVKVPMFTAQQITLVILNGEGKMAPMPGMKDQEIADVVAYCKATFK